MSAAFLLIPDFWMGLEKDLMGGTRGIQVEGPYPGAFLYLIYCFCVKRASQFYILDKRWQVHLISSELSSVLILLFLSAVFDNEEYFLLNFFDFYKALLS